MLDTYADLKAAVIDWASHSSVTAAKAADFIRAAERRAYRALRVPEVEVTTADYNGATTPKDFLVTASVNTLTLPADCQEIKDIWSYAAVTTETPPPEYSYGPRYPAIQRTSVQDMSSRLYLAAWNSSLYPTAFARDNTQLLFAPVNGSYFVRMTYWATPTFLSDVAQSNAVFATCPDMLLYGALAEAALYIRLPQDAVVMDKRFASEIELLNQRGNRAELSGSSLTQRSVFYG